MDAFAIAERDGTRIRVTDTERLQRLALSQGLDLAEIQGWAVSNLAEPKLAFIESGLMAGAYAYSLLDESVFAACASTIPSMPLANYDGMAFDVVLSYSSEDRASLALPLQRALEERGLRVYVLDVARDPDDPLWAIRFRTAMFYSHYLVPILSKCYLARAGSTRELQEMARLTVEHRETEFFYPLIGLSDPRGGTRPREEVAGSDLAFAWTHILSLPWDLSTDRLAGFFLSLSRNAAGTWDAGFLDVLSPMVRFVRSGQAAGASLMELYVEHPTLSYYVFVIDQAGTVRYLGVHEPGPDANPVTSARGLAERVSELVAQPPRVPSASSEGAGSGAASDPHDADYPDDPDDYLAEPEVRRGVWGEDGFFHSTIAGGLVRQGRWISALRHLRLAWELGESESILLDAARCNRALGRHREAAWAYRNAEDEGERRGAPEHVLKECQHALVELGAESLDTLGLGFEQALAVPPPGPADDEFDTDLFEFRALDPETLAVMQACGGARARTTAAQEAYEAGDPVRAIALLRGVVNFTVSMKSKSDTLFVAASALLEAGEPAEARRYLTWALECHENERASAVLATLERG